MSDAENNMPEPEWAHQIDVNGVEDWPLNLTISPDQAQRTRLIRRLGLLALDDCEVKLRLSRSSGHMIHVKGEIYAQVRQNCVVTMEPVQTQVEDTFEAWFADQEQAVSLAKAKRDKSIERGHGELPILDERDDPEPIIDGQIDVGELSTQYLSLSIDPYPHAPGVDKHERTGDEETTVYDDSSILKSPFAALKDWKDKLK